MRTDKVTEYSAAEKEDGTKNIFVTCQKQQKVTDSPLICVIEIYHIYIYIYIVQMYVCICKCMWVFT